MKKILVAAIALVALSGAAMADTVRLTDAQLDAVTAGYWKWRGGDSQSNTNVTFQKSESTAVAKAGCFFCFGGLNGSAAAISLSGNFNNTEQKNED